MIAAGYTRGRRWSRVLSVTGEGARARGVVREQVGAPPAATLKQKRDVDVAARLVLGACDPPLAHRDLQAEESIGLPLPCTVVVRGAGESRTVVEALDPLTMVEVTGDTALQAVADDAASRLRAGLDRVGAP